MTLDKLAFSLGITEQLPKMLYPIYEKTKDTEFSFTHAELDRLQREYELFDEDIFDALKQGLSDLLSDELLLKWAVLMHYAAANATDHEILYGMPMPAYDDSVGRDLFAIYPLLPLIENGIKKYIGLGFSLEEAKSEMKVFNGSIRGNFIKTGRMTFGTTYFAWCSIYIAALIFRCGVLNFEISQIFDPVVLLENTVSGERVILMTNGVFHRSGNFLNSAGLSEDKDGSFLADFSETDTEYVGRVARFGYLGKEVKKFPKSEWKKLLTSGTGAVSLHIPKGVDVSRESVKETIRSGMRIVRERYGKDIRFAFCRSWLLSPNISDCLSPDSKIIAFENCFERYPIQSSGKELMSFLFGGVVSDYNELPETTSLQRKIKDIYLDGGYIYAGAGLIIDEEFYE